MGNKTKIEWVKSSDGTAGRTWNPVTGCTAVTKGCDNCLAPDTLVLMADLTYRPIGDLVVGDKVLGFTDAVGVGVNRVYEEAEVLAAWRTEAEAIEVTADNGAQVIASDNHLWLTRTRWGHGTENGYPTTLPYLRKRCQLGALRPRQPEGAAYPAGHRVGLRRVRLLPCRWPAP